mmetsp:Transcript_8787/g.15915  ORF Transcript_8787/g.15915 Transcript_8787/m.15915 type:complete len:124 (-) Transcript_8787:167-538(-)
MTTGTARSSEYGAADRVNGSTTSTHITVAEVSADVTRLLQTSHTFFWAATATYSDGIKENNSLPEDFDATDWKSDLKHWNKYLGGDKRQFISMVLASFAELMASSRLHTRPAVSYRVHRHIDM